MYHKRPFLLILDEINLAVSIGLLKAEDVIALIDKAPEETIIYLTGRNAPKELVKRADVINEIKVVKYPKEIKALEGIQY